MTGFSRVFACAGSSLSARAHCSFPLGIHPAGQMMVRAAERFGMCVLMAGAGTTTPSPLQLELMQQLAPQVWMGMSSYGLHLANLADQHGIDLAAGSVEMVICSAEPLLTAKREKLVRMWGATVRDTFGMTEAGMMGAEDGEVDGFRIWTDLFLLEVVDLETRRPVPEGEVGALVVTPLFTYNATPFLRWLSGDLVAYRSEVPGSGPFSIFPVIKHAHRTAGFFKIRGVNINHSELEDLIFRDPDVNDFKCEALHARGPGCAACLRSSSSAVSSRQASSNGCKARSRSLSRSLPRLFLWSSARSPRSSNPASRRRGLFDRRT